MDGFTEEGMAMGGWPVVGRGLVVVGLVGVVLVATASVSFAAASAPPGYVIVHGPTLTAPPSGLDSGAQTSCPTGTVIWGGGVGFIGGGNQTLAIETSDPSGSAAWEARVNNTGTTTHNFVIDAICADKPSGYKIKYKTVDNPANTGSAATAVCPTGAVLLGGGALSTADVSSVELYSAWPVGETKFRARMFNGSSSDAKLTAFAICATKPTGYVIVRQAAVMVDPGFTLDDGTACPTNTSAISGGVKVLANSGTIPVLPISDSIDQGAFGWVTDTTNTTPVIQQVANSVICAA